MKFLLSGYYGFGNAGDEAVLAAILQAISQQKSGARFVVTSGNPQNTIARFNGAQTPVEAIARQSPRALVDAIRSCDVFISGGGSLLQDVTSLRNVVYYSGLLRLARLSRKPAMIYAQGIGPLIRPLSQKLARIAAQQSRVVTVRDEDSKKLLEQIGVRRKIEVTADPVWALSPQSQSLQPKSTPEFGGKTLCASLRPWQGYDFSREGNLARGWQNFAQKSGARFRFVPMQDEIDRPVMENLATPNVAVINTADLHPREIMSLCGDCHAMIAMRLHALIFAAAQGVPCVAVNYDPKVASLANIIDAPLLENLGESELQKLPDFVQSARAMSAQKLAQLQSLARRNAELAVAL